MKKSILLSCFSLFLITQLANAQTELWGMTPVGGYNPVIGNGKSDVIFKIDLGGANYDEAETKITPDLYKKHGAKLKYLKFCHFNTSFIFI